jgi:hypothetical protein
MTDKHEPARLDFDRIRERSRNSKPSAQRINRRYTQDR